MNAARSIEEQLNGCVTPYISQMWRGQKAGRADIIAMIEASAEVSKPLHLCRTMLKT